jgi:hypothetical protein
MLPKSQWGKGPWQDEPDHLEWDDQETGLRCMIEREIYFGTLCGYVGIGPTHPAYEIHHDGASFEEAKLYRESLRANLFSGNVVTRPEPIPGVGEIVHSIKVHGGLTFSGKIVDGSTLWYFGFDCCHAFDVMPFRWKEFDDVRKKSNFKIEYRTIDYVKGECHELARQLKVLEVKVPFLQVSSDRS